MFKYILAVFTLLFAGPVFAADCSYDGPAMLALDLKAFDQDMKGGWRPLADMPECRPQAADLIRAWREAHAANLSAEDNQSLTWHEGQLRAALNDYAGAIPLISVMLTHQDEAMRDYAAATVAFLKRDKPALLAVRQQMTQVPKPEGFDEAAVDYEQKYHQKVIWPDNLDVVDGLIACFDKPYAEAYGSTCRPAS